VNHANCFAETSAAIDRTCSVAERGALAAFGPVTLAAMGLGYAVVQLDVTIVKTALASISASLGDGVTELQWVVSVTGTSGRNAGC
jgi:hypothetical protein